ncbi:MAG: hypothetical protein J6U52_00450 [Alistipes sp.]|nr:hypothetical protein [Alistipes sp.]
MEKKQLVCSDVDFDAQSHTYKLNGLPLSGVTPIIAWLFPDTYKGIPQSVLSQAAAYGTEVHKACEVYDSLDILPEDDYLKEVVYQYASVTKTLPEVACSEYLVSDEYRIASCIDKVFVNDALADIKTTSKVHGLLVQLQLSIYAWLYEKQNPERKVPALYLIWLPKPQYGVPAVKQLERIPASICEYIVEVWAADGDRLSAMAALTGCGVALEYDNPPRKAGEIPENVQALVDELIVVKKQLDYFAEREKEIKNDLLVTMSNLNEDKWADDLIQITKKAAYLRESIDTKALKADNPEIYAKYKKETKVSESLTYKVL